MTARPLADFSIGGGRRLGGLVLLGAFVGVVVGLMSARVSPAMPIAVAFAAATVIVVARRPEVGALAVVCLTLVVPRELLFERGISLGGGSLKVTDLLILLTLAAWIAHRALDRDARRLPSMAASLLVLGIVLCGVGALLTNADRGGSTQFALTDFRPFLSLLLVFPLVAFVSDQPSLRRSLGAVLLAAAAGGVWISFLFLRGEGAKASFSGGALRVTEVSFVAPMIATVWALVLLPHCRTIGQRTAVAFLAVASFSALFFTLQRAAWISLAVGGLVAAILMTPRRRARLLSSVVVILLCAGVAIVALNSVSSARVGNPLQSGLERLQSVGSYETDVSALHREAETREALRQIRIHPLTGIGLGGAITFFSPFYNPATQNPGVQYTTTYLHNSYTWMALKTGIPGLLLLVATVGFVLVRGARLAVRGSSRFVKVGALGIVASLTSIAECSFTGPHLTSDLGVPYLAAVLAGVEVLRRLDSVPATALDKV